MSPRLLPPRRDSNCPRVPRELFWFSVPPVLPHGGRGDCGRLSLIRDRSLLRAIIGLQQPSDGTVTCDLDRGDVGILFQDDALLPWRTALDNVALGLRIRGKPRPRCRDEAEEWLGRLGLAGFAQRFPRALSGGQRKRVALAQVLALEPRLLLMDEPFAALDAIVRHRITQDLLDLVEG